MKLRYHPSVRQHSLLIVTYYYTWTSGLLHPVNELWFSNLGRIRYISLGICIKIFYNVSLGDKGNG